MTSQFIEGPIEAALNERYPPATARIWTGAITRIFVFTLAVVAVATASPSSFHSTIASSSHAVTLCCVSVFRRFDQLLQPQPQLLVPQIANGGAEGKEGIVLAEVWRSGGERENVQPVSGPSFDILVSCWPPGVVRTASCGH